MRIDLASRVDISSHLSQRLSVFGIVNAMLIVLIHSTPIPMKGTWQWWLVEVLGRDGICRIAVPYFFLVGGFFLAGHVCEERWWLHEVRKRLRSLAIPYFLWIIIGLFVNSVFWVGIQWYGVSCGFANPFYGPIHLWLINTFGLSPFQNEIGILWFVRNLFVLVVISPLLLLIIKHIGFSFVILIFTIYCCAVVLEVNIDKGWFNFLEYYVSIRGLCYFTLGIVLRYIHVCDNGLQFVKKRLFLVLGSMGVLLKILCMSYGYLGLAAIFDVIMVPVLGFGVFYALERVRFPSWLTRNAFPIYLLHQVFLLFSIVILTLLGLRGMMNTSIVIWVLRFVFALTLSFVSTILLRNYMPNVSRLLLGGR